MTETESAVLVPVPEAERVVSRHRARLDGAAALGVPAHVTVLFPFVPPSAITATTLESLAAAVASVGAFDCEFAVTAWFGSDVLWLAPRPVAARVGRVWLMTGGAAPGSWRNVAEFPLGP